MFLILKWMAFQHLKAYEKQNKFKVQEKAIESSTQQNQL